MARKNNFPTGQLENIPAEYTKEMVGSLMQLYSKGKPKTDEEVRQRLNDFFQFCDNSCIRPGIEVMALSLSVSRQTLCNWENGINCSKERQEIIIQAKLFCTSFLEQLMLHNKVFPGTGCFFLKNWAHYQDSISIDAGANNANTISQLSIEEIRDRYRAQEEFREKPQLPEGID